ncbi:MAG: hypothetical protein WDW36_000440 [Sanguina aurantia]
MARGVVRVRRFFFGASAAVIDSSSSSLNAQARADRRLAMRPLAGRRGGAARSSAATVAPPSMPASAQPAAWLGAARVLPGSAQA